MKLAGHLLVDVDVDITPEVIDAFRTAMNGPVAESRFLASYNVPDYRIREGIRAALAAATAQVRIK